MPKYDIQCIHITGLSFKAKNDEEAEKKADELIKEIQTSLDLGWEDLQIDDYEVEEE